MASAAGKPREKEDVYCACAGILGPPSGWHAVLMVVVVAIICLFGLAVLGQE